MGLGMHALRLREAVIDDHSLRSAPGVVYYWSAVLASRHRAPLISFIDGWITLVGNWTIILSMSFSGVQLTLSGIPIFGDDLSLTNGRPCCACGRHVHLQP